MLTFYIKDEFFEEVQEEQYDFLKAPSKLDIIYEDEQIDLEPGTRIVAYTDGVTEAENDRLELYGEERLIGSIGQIEAGVEEKAVVDHLYRSVKSFTAGHPQSDDITIMSLSL